MNRARVSGITKVSRSTRPIAWVSRSSRIANRSSSSDAPRRLSQAVSASTRIADLVVPGLEARASGSEEHTSELQSLMRISYDVFCLKKKIQHHQHTIPRLH